MEQYDALFLYFEKEKALPDSDKAQALHSQLSSQYTKLYLEFLEYVLPFITKINKEFQSEKPKIYTLHRKMEAMFLSVVELYMKAASLKEREVSTLQFKSPTEFVKLQDVYLGPKVMAAAQLMNQNSVNLKTFRTNCLNFLIELADQIFTRFPFTSNDMKALKHMEFIDPLKFKETIPIAGAALLLAPKAGIEFTEAETEFRLLKKYRKDNVEMDATIFWQQVENMKDADGNPQFPTLLKLGSFHLYFAA